ncbi:SDR family NAD(P)-dependent oxidoreductase [Aggregicoccus sp. 17bor-14]|uniref:SDR family NAD(P)-dependent oxidoreductase n=1 Tax=Myxococcaceae TaxID=31 RepID=UPI00129C8AC2|nr:MULTISPECIES: SDR family NAD(P)-dependent oxidoreductase [Myxococcaceae]MBF5045456.1 SDR family NAD(P)-dependent oxidoreductase [Simulacricoccus sp. 17bor-14]MRI91194.1 SDR family NAD(P)-dependent oxidoreductase [Aggregicoccus sp. 17bor-14]
MSKPLAVVTGASSGIGLELAKQFAQNGFDLLVTAESDALQAATRELEGLGVQVESVQADLATCEGVEALYARIQSLGRPVAAAALNAGVGVGGDFARETDLKAELNLIALNVTSSVHLAKRLARDMVARKEGRLLFTSSIAATMPSPLEAVYGASKAFLSSFAASLRNELADAGITVTALMPGPTETNFFHRAGMDDTRVGQDEKDDPAQVARQGFEALMGGEAKAVAGSTTNKVMAAANKVLPDAAKAKMHRHMSEKDPKAKGH